MNQFPQAHLDLDFLDGWLAGDGSLVLPVRCRNVLAQMSTSKFGYACYVWQRFDLMGFPCPDVRERHFVSIRGHVRPGGYVKCDFKSHAHPALTEQFHRWYPSGSKRFPSDFRLSRDSLLQWYLGDGTVNSKWYPRISVHLPVIPDIEHVLSGLRELFGKVRFYKRRGSSIADIHFGAEANRAFFDYIGQCPVSAYLYRWPFSPQLPNEGARRCPRPGRFLDLGVVQPI